MDSSPSTGTIVTSRLRRYAVDHHKVKALAKMLARHLAVDDRALEIGFVGARRMRTLNQKFRHKDRSTDVLSFPQQEWSRPQPVQLRPRKKPTAKDGTPPPVLGDLVISLADAERNAHNIGQALDREVCFLMIHGMLHLVGHDHGAPTEERRMLAAQRSLVRIVSAPQRRAIWQRCVRVRA